MAVCQVIFFEAVGIKTRYSGKYQDQNSPTASKSWMDKLRKSNYSTALLVDHDIKLADLCSPEVNKIAYLPWDKRYCVTDKGDIISLIGDPKRLSEFTRGESRYKLVQIAGKVKIYVHRLVAAAFLGPPYFDGQMHIVRHLDGNPINNSLDNIAYGTNKDNADDARKHGKIYMGESNHNSTLTEDQVREIRQIRYRDKTGIKEIATVYDVSRETISRILRREAWSHINDGLGNLCNKRHKPYPLVDEQKEDIDQRLLNGEDRKLLAEEYGVPVRVIHHRASKIMKELSL